MSELQDVKSLLLPENYDFEVEKIISRIDRERAKRVTLQLPEGLQQYGAALKLIIETFVSSSPAPQIILIGDVTYGGCCIDDLQAVILGSDLLIHFGHSCLIPIYEMSVKVLYIFVKINLDVTFAVKNIANVIPLIRQKMPIRKIGLQAVIQYVHLLPQLKVDLQQILDVYTISDRQSNCTSTSEHCLSQASDGASPLTAPTQITISSEKPLSAGETLGCTSATLDCDICFFVADGRFHLESSMIQNPKVKFYRIDPVHQLVIDEKYDHGEMLNLRNCSIEQFASNVETHENPLVLIFLSTLGRQGSTSIAARVKDALKRRYPHAESVLVLMSEFTTQNLETVVAGFGEVSGIVQVGCPRMSIDWGHHFAVPFLNPQEAFRALAENGHKTIQHYKMDYFSRANLSSSLNQSEDRPWINYDGSKEREISRIRPKYSPQVLAMKRVLFSS